MYRPTCRVDGAHSEGIWSVCWKEGKIITGAMDGSCKLWNTSIQKEGEDLLPKSASANSSKQSFGITSIVASSDGEFGVNCSQNAVIRFFNLSDMTETGSIDAGLLEAWTVCLSPGDDMIATGSHTGNINIWSVAEKAKVCSLVAKGKLILSTSFNSDGTNIAAGGIDGSLHILDVITQQVIHKIEAHCLPIRKVAYSADGGLIFTASDDRHVSVFDARSGLAINSFSHSGMALGLDLSPDRRHFAVGCSDHVVAYWDLGMQRCVHRFDAPHTEQVWDVAFHSSGKKFVTVGEEGILQVFESS